MKLYIIKAFNSTGGGIGTYHVIASGVNAAKRAVKEQEPIAKRVVCTEEIKVIITN